MRTYLIFGESWAQGTTPGFPGPIYGFIQKMQAAHPNDAVKGVECAGSGMYRWQENWPDAKAKLGSAKLNGVFLISGLQDVIAGKTNEWEANTAAFLNQVRADYPDQNVKMVWGHMERPKNSCATRNNVWNALAPLLALQANLEIPNAVRCELGQVPLKNDCAHPTKYGEWLVGQRMGAALVPIEDQ